MRGKKSVNGTKWHVNAVSTDGEWTEIQKHFASREEINELLETLDMLLVDAFPVGSMILPTDVSDAVETYNS